jgi:translation initiation factor IF-1
MVNNQLLFSLGGIEKVLPQTGTRISLKRDASRGAKLPGKRISRTGKIYWETRKNRSDAPLKDI